MGGKRESPFSPCCDGPLVGQIGGNSKKGMSERGSIQQTLCAEFCARAFFVLRKNRTRKFRGLVPPCPKKKQKIPVADPSQRLRVSRSRVEGIGSGVETRDSLVSRRRES